MNPTERAQFLDWLRGQTVEQLQEVVSHVSTMISAKRGAKLRHVLPGMRLVVDLPHKDGKTYRDIVTVIRTNKVSVVAWDGIAHLTVNVDNVVGIAINDDPDSFHSLEATGLAGHIPFGPQPAPTNNTVPALDLDELGNAAGLTDEDFADDMLNSGWEHTNDV